MPTLSTTPAKKVSPKGRTIVKHKISRKGASFGAAVKKYAGIVRSGICDLSTGLGRDAQPNETTAAAIRESLGDLPKYRNLDEAWSSLKSDAKRRSKKPVSA